MPVSPSSGQTLAVPGTWSGLLTGDLAREAERVLASIESAIEAAPASDASLANGLAGEAVFFTYLNEAAPTPARAAASKARLEMAIEAVASSPLPPALYAGFTGVAWAVEHLLDEEASAREDLNADIDQALLEVLSLTPWRRDYDLILGLAGYGLYGLDRAYRPSGRALLEKVLDRLQETAVPMERGIAWHTHPGLLPEWQRRAHPEGHYNLGLAHGVPGVIAFLGQAASTGHGRAAALLKGAVEWLLSQRLPASEACCFKSIAPVASPMPEPVSRIAWCYGDLGLSVALLWAARSVGAPGWEEEAVSIALQAARRPLSDAGAMDAGLCHGSAGNAHLFNRLYQATGKPAFKEAALTWYRDVLDRHQAGAGSGGYLAWQPSGGQGEPWQANAGFLEGSAGIGLALSAAISPVLPEWDRALLVSVPPRSAT